MVWPVITFRLVSERSEAGLYCGKDGVSLGGVPLLIKDDSGFDPLPTEKLQQIFDAAYGSDSGIDAQSRLRGLSSAARALDVGNLSVAMIASLQLKLPDIDADGMARLARTKTLIKFNYNNGENRDWHGRWANGSTGSRNPLATQVQTLPIPGIVPMPAPIGGFPGQKPKDDDFTFPPSNEPANDNSPSPKPVIPVAPENRPKLCPPETPESTANRTFEQLMYQQQITGLPIGFDVTLNGVRYDGCREDNGNMQEAKLGLDWMLGKPAFVIRLFKGYKDLMDQATRQSLNAGGRIVEWHFSDPGVTLFFRGEFERAGLNNIWTFYSPYLGPKEDEIIRHYQKGS